MKCRYKNVWIFEIKILVKFPKLRTNLIIEINANFAIKKFEYFLTENLVTFIKNSAHKFLKIGTHFPCSKMYHAHKSFDGQTRNI